MRPLAAFSVIAATTLAACASGNAPPSLLPRAAEQIDPRVPVGGAVNLRPVSPALASRLADLLGQARNGNDAFSARMADAERLAASAGPPQGESWTVAQQALSAAVAARAPTTRALGDIDALAAEALQRQGGLSPADLAAIRSAAEAAAAIERSQADRIDRAQRMLGD